MGIPPQAPSPRQGTPLAGDQQARQRTPLGRRRPETPLTTPASLPALPPGMGRPLSRQCQSHGYLPIEHVTQSLRKGAEERSRSVNDRPGSSTVSRQGLDGRPASASSNGNACGPGHPQEHPPHFSERRSCSNIPRPSSGASSSGCTAASGSRMPRPPQSARQHTEQAGKLVGMMAYQSPRQAHLHTPAVELPDAHACFAAAALTSRGRSNSRGARNDALDVLLAGASDRFHSRGRPRPSPSPAPTAAPERNTSSPPCLPEIRSSSADRFSIATQAQGGGSRPTTIVEAHSGSHSVFQQESGRRPTTRHASDAPLIGISPGQPSSGLDDLSLDELESEAQALLESICGGQACDSPRSSPSVTSVVCPQSPSILSVHLPDSPRKSRQQTQEEQAQADLAASAESIICISAPPPRPRPRTPPRMVRFSCAAGDGSRKRLGRRRSHFSTQDKVEPVARHQSPGCTGVLGGA